MSVTIDGSGTITGISAGGLPDASIVTADIADANVTAAKLSGAQTGSAPIYGCRAWVNFDGTRNEADTGSATNGANVKIRASGNVTSVLKNGTGDYTITFTTAMPDANYAAFQGGMTGSISISPEDRTTTTLRVLTTKISSGSQGVPENQNQVDVAVFR